MNNRVAFAVSAALMSMTVNAATEMDAARGTDFINLQQQAVLKAVPVNSVKSKARQTNNVVFVEEQNLPNEKYRYIVRLSNDPVATYKGGVEGFVATNPSVAGRSMIAGVNKTTTNHRLDANAPHVKAYQSFLDKKQNTFISKANAKVGRKLDVKQRTQLAVNAIVVEMTQAEAKKLSRVDGVAFIQREKLRYPTTDSGPQWIRADHIWSGAATGVASKGEGKVVGIIDTGINADNPSFADVAGDGYDHENPYGKGVYFGDCLESEWASLCNDKLVGVVSYPEVLNQYADYDPTVPLNGVDHNGHGSHTAATTAGNELTNVAVTDAEGNPGSVVFDNIAGVAPRANIISYQVCLPGENDAIGFRGCFPSLTIQAIEHAIANNVDALNYSIGGGSSNPWNDADSLAFLSAREAGIHVATSAGNSGPEPETVGSPGDAPWLTTVGAFTHNRGFTEKGLTELSGGTTAAPEGITGSSMTGAFTGEIVYAGNYTNPNDPDNDPAQCLQPFPKETFTANQIVMCDRGAIARVQKGINVRDGGAGGLIFANIDGGATSVVADPHVLPAIHVNAENGNLLRAWLNDGGAGHTGTITASEITHDDSFANIAAGFTSRGPGASVPDVLVPDLSAPGVSIFAAYADEQSAGFKEFPDPSDYAFLSGTSMASPHVAGALTLINSIKPDWSPAAVQSALMLTANPMSFKEDGTTAADFFDMGAGMIRVGMAANAGIVLDEDQAGYIAADPATGDPKDINMASLTNSACVGICSWTRTFTATKDGSWTTSQHVMTEGLTVEVSPATFTLSAGETQQVTITANAIAAPSDEWAFSHVVLESDTSPTLMMPVSVKPANGNVPSAVSIMASRDKGTYLLTGLQSVAISDFTAHTFGLKHPDIHYDMLPVDSQNGDAYDDLTDGIKTFWVTAPEGAKRIVAEILKSESPDLDLRIGLDTDGEGDVDADEEVAISATSTALEKVDLIMPAAGNYWITVQNWSASSEGAEDAFELATVVIDDMMSENFTVEGPDMVDQLTDYDIRFNWDVDFDDANHIAYGYAALGPDADNVGALARIAVDVHRGDDDVMLASNVEDGTRLEAGDKVDYTVTVMPNMTPEDKDYTISVALPEGLVLDAGSVTGEGTVNGNAVSWEHTQVSLMGAMQTYNRVTNVEDSTCAVNDFGQGSGYLDLAGFGLLPSTMDGDSTLGSFNVNANFMGNLYTDVSVSDDGFIFFSGTEGTEPWTNQFVPSEAAPNDLIAPLWRDLQIARSDTSGVTVATAGEAWTIIEFDDMRHYNFYNGQPEVSDVLDFEIVINNATGDFVIAYDNVTHEFGDNIPTTIGWEDSMGMHGDMLVYRGNAGEDIGTMADITSGLVVCYNLEMPSTAPTTFSFSATVAEDFGGDLTATLTNTLAGVGTEESSVSVEVEGGPMATISAQSLIQEGDLVVLDGTPSVDPNGDPVTFAWTQLSGPAVSFDASGSQVSFTAPAVEVDTAMTFELTVTDGMFTDTNQVTVTIQEGNPIISISAPDSVQEGGSVSIDAHNTVDPNGDFMDFAWTQLNGPAVNFTVSGDHGEMISFDTGNVTEDQIVTFELTVTDAFNTSTETVSLTILEGTPVIDIVGPFAVEERGTITVNASGSSDPNGDDLTFTFSQVNGVAASISSNGGVLTITGPDVSDDTTLTFEVVVSDGVNSASEQFTVTVSNKSGGGSMGWIALALLPIIGLRRRNRR